MKIKILTTQETLLEGEAKEIILPGDDGEFSVMDFHEPCLYRLRAGQIKVRLRKEESEGKWMAFPVKTGFARIGPFAVSIMVETY